MQHIYCKMVSVSIGLNQISPGLTNNMMGVNLNYLKQGANFGRRVEPK